MIVTRGLGVPGGLLVSGGMGSILLITPTGETYIMTVSGWELITGVYVMQSGSWQPVSEMYAHKSGSWVQAW